MGRLKQHGMIVGAIAALVVLTSIGVTGMSAQQTATVVDAKVLNNAGTSHDSLPGDWLSYGRSQGETRYSPLNKINTSNVNRLGLSWTYSLGPGGGNQEATPLVWNNTIFGITNWSVVFAVDARTGKELWRWDPGSESDRGPPQDLLRHRQPRAGDL